MFAKCPNFSNRGIKCLRNIMCLRYYSPKICSFVIGSRAMLFSTRRIARGGAICPLPKKTHKDLCDMCKNRRGVYKSSIHRQKCNYKWIEEILKKLDQFEFCVNRIYVPLTTKTSKLESNKCINFLYKSFLFRFFRVKWSLQKISNT